MVEWGGEEVVPGGHGKPVSHGRTLLRPSCVRNMPGSALSGLESRRTGVLSGGWVCGHGALLCWEVLEGGEVGLVE